MKTTELHTSVEGHSLDAVVRRRLIVDFFALGTISRWDVCEIGGWLTEADLAHHSGQERWAVAFKRAEERGELDKMRELVDAKTPNS